MVSVPELLETVQARLGRHLSVLVILIDKVFQSRYDGLLLIIGKFKHHPASLFGIERITLHTVIFSYRSWTPLTLLLYLKLYWSGHIFFA